MAVLVLLEHEGAGIRQASRSALKAASLLGGEVDAVIAGEGVAEAAQAAAKLPGLRRVWVADSPALAHGLAEPLAALLAALAPDYTHIVAAATAFGKNVMPRLAGLLDVQPVSDVIAIEGPDTFVRPIYAGNALATVRSEDAKKVLTIRPTAFDAVPAEGGQAEISPAPLPDFPRLSRFIGAELTKSERPELTAARVVISGGRGMQSAENFRMLERIADKLGGAVGASRAAVDAGYAPNDLQVGQTGKVVAPELYIAVGISGAIQHLAGMKDSKVIVAINKDEEAPIFQVADYGLVADLFKALPELEAELDKLKAT
jgi:electron transfer flavoprotein alpha subunit